MTALKDSFSENAAHLRKIIKENIFFGIKTQDEAEEFLDAMIRDHQKEVKDLKDNMILVEEDPDNGDFFIDSDKLSGIDYGLGELLYYNQNINFRFREALESFVENFKNNNRDGIKNIGPDFLPACSIILLCVVLF